MAGFLGKMCGYPRCPTIFSGTGSYCSKHKEQVRLEGLQRLKMWSRLKEKNPFYSTARWKKLRAFMIRKFPVCQECNWRASTEVHHIKPLSTHPELAYETSNLQCLCKTCHWSHTQKEIKDRRKERANK